MIKLHRFLRKVLLWDFYLCCLIVWKYALHVRDVKDMKEASKIVDINVNLFGLILALEQYLNIKRKEVF